MNIAEVEAALLLSDADVAQAFGVPQAVVAAWRAGITVPHNDQMEKLEVLADMAKMVREAYPSDEGVDLWMNAQSRYLFANLPKIGANNEAHWMTPREAILGGHVYHARGAIAAHMEGVFL